MSVKEGLRMNDYPYPVGPGWWLLLDDHIPAMYEIDPGITGMDIKEKYGTCRVDFYPGDEMTVDSTYALADCVTSQSVTICENCGGHRSKPDKWRPWCDRCKAATNEELRAIRMETMEKYFRGSHIRHTVTMPPVQHTDATGAIFDGETKKDPRKK